MLNEKDIQDIKQDIKELKRILGTIDLKPLSQKLDKIIGEQEKQKSLLTKLNSTDFFDIVKGGFFLSLSGKISNIEDKLNQLIKK